MDVIWRKRPQRGVVTAKSILKTLSLVHIVEGNLPVMVAGWSIWEMSVSINGHVHWTLCPAQLCSVTVVQGPLSSPRIERQTEFGDVVNSETLYGRIGSRWHRLCIVFK